MILGGSQPVDTSLHVRHHAATRCVPVSSRLVIGQQSSVGAAHRQCDLICKDPTSSKAPCTGTRGQDSSISFWGTPFTSA